MSNQYHSDSLSFHDSNTIPDVYDLFRYKFENSQQKKQFIYSLYSETLYLGDTSLTQLDGSQPNESYIQALYYIGQYMVNVLPYLLRDTIRIVQSHGASKPRHTCKYAILTGNSLKFPKWTE